MKHISKILVCVFSVLALVLFYLIPRFIKINNIPCRFQMNECNKVIVNELQKFKGKDLRSVKLNVTALLKKDINVVDFHLEFKIPDSINVYIIERKPKYSISTESKNKFVLADNDGRTLSLTDSSDLPNLIVSGNLPELGDRIGRDELFALELIYDINETFQVKEGKLVSDSLLIELPGSLRVIFPVEGDREVLIGSLIIINNEIKNGKDTNIENTSNNINTIDLRYKNPILKVS